MNLNVLVLDPDGEISKLLADLLDGSGLVLKRTQSVREAKSFLVQSGAAVLIAQAVTAEDNELGLNLCRELRSFEAYKELPVLLFADAADESMIRSSVAAGVNGMLIKPFTVAGLRTRLGLVIPQLKSAAPVPTAPASQSLKEAGNGAAKPEGDDLERKLKVVQTILAKVLHNLKTSDLLVISEEEDVPRIVYEMTRTVCGISDAGAAKVRRDKPVEAEVKVDLNLDNVFGRK